MSDPAALRARLDLPASLDAWLAERCAAIAALAPGAAVAPLVLALGQAARRCGEDGAQSQSMDGAIAAWTRLQAVRATLFLALRADDASAWLAALDELCRHADLGEQVALYRALPLLPHGPLLTARAAVGIRSSMTDVVAAVAHGNPYPARHLEAEAWNQMVLKCLFTALGLDPIIGLDQRANAGLSAMLRDYARERRAAHRPIHPELWRALAPHADDRGAELLLAAAAAPDAAAGATAELGVQAARLACAACPHPRVRAAAVPPATRNWSAIHTETRRILT
jgi:hypothetical protein